MRLTLRDSKGAIVGIPRTVELLGGAQLTAFVHELFGSAGAEVAGTIEVASSRAIEIAALLGALNARREFMYTAVPVVDYAAPGMPQGPLLGPFADSAFESTTAVIVNLSNQSARAALRFFDGSGAATAVDIR